MDKKLISAIWVCLVFILCGCASPNRQMEARQEKTFVPFAKGVTAGSDHEDPEIASSINHMPGSGTPPARNLSVDALVVHPRRLQIKVGEVFSLKKLIITALDSNGQPVRHIPFSVQAETSDPDMLETQREHPELVKGLRPGKIDLRFVSRVSRPDGTYPAAYATLYVLP